MTSSAPRASADSGNTRLDLPRRDRNTLHVAMAALGSVVMTAIAIGLVVAFARDAQIARSWPEIWVRVLSASLSGEYQDRRYWFDLSLEGLDEDVAPVRGRTVRPLLRVKARDSDLVPSPAVGETLLVHQNPNRPSDMIPADRIEERWIKLFHASALLTGALVCAAYAIWRRRSFWGSEPS